MLPLRVNRKPQLLPIKQLLTKQREENLRVEDDHSLNTDDYLLWKTENEPVEKKSVSFRPMDDEIKSRTRDQAIPENRHFKRAKHEIFLHDNVSLWDSDEADDSLQNQLGPLSPMKDYDFENRAHSLNVSNSKSRPQRKSASSINQKKKDENLVKKLIETIDHPIKESMENLQHNLSSSLELRIGKEMSAFRNILGSLSETDEKVLNLLENLRELTESDQQELMKLKTAFLNHIDSVATHETSKSDDFKYLEERICNQMTENINKTIQNLETQIKDMLTFKQESHEASVTDKHETFFRENATKLQELDTKIESLRKEMSKITEVVAETRHKNPEPPIKVAPRRPIAEETSLKIDDINSSNFYQNVDAELEKYRNVYIDKISSSGDRYQKFRPFMFVTNKNKWKPW